MWLDMKIHDIISEEDIREILISYKIKHLRNIFELMVKNIKCIKKQNKIGMDLVLFEANMAQMKLQKSESSLIRESSNNYVVTCTNIKNENGEYFSYFVNTLNENDRIVFVNAIVQRIKKTICVNSDKTIITIRPENNPLVFVFKYRSLCPEKLNVEVSNLSRLTNSGTYSLFGCVKRIIKYSDEDYMLLRIQCNDKSFIKIHKFPHSVQEFSKISKVEKISGVKYDYSSNNVDILIKTPSDDFISLVPKQRIYLNNVKVKYSDDIHLYSLYIKGHAKNIRADPVVTSSINSLRPPTKYFPIPNELKPTAEPKKKQIVSNEFQSTSKDLLYQKLNKIVAPPSKLKLSTKQSQKRQIESTNSSSEDDVNLSPCQDFLPLEYICNNDNIVNNGDLVCNNNMNDNSHLLIKKTIPDSQTHNQIQKLSNNLPIIPLNKANTSKTKETCLSRENSPEWSTDGSCSPSFLNTQEIPSSNTKPSFLNQPLNTVKKSTLCIGPCRFIYFEPNIFDTVDIVHGYCVQCFVFIQKSFLKSSNDNYKCPKCFSIVQLTFFFKITFLYGKNEDQAIEVCCYNEKAERIIQKLTKKTINVENYLLNYDYKKLVSNTIKSMIYDKTKVNIVICKSPNDKTNILLSIDTKYVVTIPVD